VVQLAAARVEYAGMILSGQAASDLDELELTLGRRGDRELVQQCLATAREQYQKAAAALKRLLDDLRAHEENLLALGLYDVLTQTNLDATFNLGWTCYYLGRFESADVRRHELLAEAERCFQQILNTGQTGQGFYQCYMARGMVQRERGEFADAEQSFAQALSGPDVQRALEVQTRYELARAQLAARKFDEARTTLKPLVDLDVENLAPADRPARFYINLAQLWDAHSYLLEAEALRAALADGPGRTAILQKVQRMREAGLTRFRQLARRGGAWPALVQLYVGASVDQRTPIAELSPEELLFMSTGLLEARKYEPAHERLNAAAERLGLLSGPLPPNTDADLAANVLYELGRCRYLMRDERGAAELLARVAAEFRSHEKGPQAATFAYALWARQAEHTRARADYAQLADVLRNLLESYGDHPKRVEAMWLLPVALQLGDEPAAAAEEFGKVPEKSEHWEEAQYRRAICDRRAIEATRATRAPDDYVARARAAADLLLKYADGALQRAAQSANSKDLLRWSADARVSAGELLTAPGVAGHEAALAAVAQFETLYPNRSPGHEQLGRMLAVRIRAHRGLRQFEQAARILEQYLQTADPEQAGATLAALAKGMQDEVQRLLETRETEAAQALAADALTTFAELRRWVEADPARAKSREPVLIGQARMLYLARQYDEALQITAVLLARQPRNGNYQHLQAQVLTARLDAGPSSQPAAEPATDAIQAAQEAWGHLLADAALRQRAPERYWEARHNWLALELRLGRPAVVEQAIKQERIWRRDMGGAEWQEQFRALEQQARVAQGLPPEAPEPAETQPAAAPESAPTP
ncbi:MAG: hypothetical protein AB1716_21835, partial [Planctomycetota bacterium]